jgi:GxxExxY protein
VPDPSRHDFTHHDLTGQILRACFEVYGELGTGFLESVYEAAVCAVLSRSGLIVQQQVILPVWFRGEPIARFRADAVVEGVVVLELKAARAIDPVHEAQLLNYLKASRIGIGLLFNFGPRPRFKRMIFTPPGTVQTPVDSLLLGAEASHP